MSELLSPTKWVFTDAVWTPSTLRPGQQAMDVGYQASQKLSGLVYGQSYTLRFKGKNASLPGSCTVQVIFRTSSGEPIRVHSGVIDSTAWVDGLVEFTCPPYPGNAWVTITSTNGRTTVDSVSLVHRATISRTEPITFGPSPFIPAGHTLTFNDEFSGTTLNRKKWFTRTIYQGGQGDCLNDEQQRYRDNGNHVVGNGVLKLVARKVGTGYESGMIRSDATFRYGYFEARVRMPKGIGVAPAFWLNPDVSGGGRLTWPPEIDNFEFVNNGVEDKPNMLHSGVVKRSGAPYPLIWAAPEWKEWAGATFYLAPFDFTDAGHVIGMLWEPGRVTLYVDSKKIYTRECPWVYEDGTPGPPAHIILNLAIGGAWAGRHGIDDSKLPFEFVVDYVRVYQKV